MRRERHHVTRAKVADDLSNRQAGLRGSFRRERRAARPPRQVVEPRDPPAFYGLERCGGGQLAVVVEAIRDRDDRPPGGGTGG